MDKLESIYTDYMRDIEQYLVSKLPNDLPVSVYQEISAHIANRTAVLAMDVIRDRDKMWERNIDRMNKKRAVYRSKSDMQRSKRLVSAEENPHD